MFEKKNEKFLNFIEFLKYKFDDTEFFKNIEMSKLIFYSVGYN